MRHLQVLFYNLFIYIFTQELWNIAVKCVVIQKNKNIFSRNSLIKAYNNSFYKYYGNKYSWKTWNILNSSQQWQKN